MNEKEKACCQCGKVFEPLRRTAKYCSNDCKITNWNNKIREEKKLYKTIDELTQEDFNKIVELRPELKIKINK